MAQVICRAVGPVFLRELKCQGFGPAQIWMGLSSHHIEGGAVGIFRYIFIAIFGNDQNIVFTISARSSLPIRNCDHGFHGNDHARLEDRIYVLAQLESSLPTVVMA